MPVPLLLEKPRGLEALQGTSLCLVSSTGEPSSSSSFFLLPSFFFSFSRVFLASQAFPTQLDIQPPALSQSATHQTDLGCSLSFATHQLSGLYLSVPQFPHTWNGTSDPHLTWLCEDAIYHDIKDSAWRLAYGQYLQIIAFPTSRVLLPHTWSCCIAPRFHLGDRSTKRGYMCSTDSVAEWLSYGPQLCHFTSCPVTKLVKLLNICTSVSSAAT